MLDKKPYENILICEASYQILIAAKCLHIMFNKVDGFLRDFDGTKEISDDDLVLEKSWLCIMFSFWLSYFSIKITTSVNTKRF